MKKKLLTAAASVGLILSIWSGGANAASPTYDVQAGDTLWKIATTNGITVSQLIEWNSLSNSTIYVGQKLIVGEDTTTVTPSSTYTVKSGDTLWSIATRYNLTVTQLKTMNSLTSDMIYVGQVLKVSTSGTQTQVSKVDSLITEAKKYIGTPYVYGGTTPAGFDCSGYLGYVFNKVGVSLPRTVALIWSGTKTVSTPNVGDLVFFNTSGTGPSHAGIYLGDNKFIHSGSSTGVTISDMNNSYWKPRYLGAKTAF